jgi:fluoride exporter
MNAGWFAAVLLHPATLISIGGAVGSNARYWLGIWFRIQPWAKNFYWGTFVINVSGSILLGVVAALCKDRTGPGFLLFGTGFCGGYTTFSTFSLEAVEAVQRGRWDLAAVYIGTSVVGGFIGCAAAWALVEKAGN